MSAVGPYGPYLSFGRRGPIASLALLLGGCGLAVAVVLLATGSGCRPDRFAGGSGSGRDPGSPLLVDGPAALLEVARCPDRHFRQVADVVAPNPWTPLGPGGSAGPAFTGSYDGGGHRIAGIRVFLPGTSEAGMFGVLDGAVVRDLVLEDVTVEAAARVGAVAGRAVGSTRILGVVVRDARVAGGEDVGGLVGHAAPEVQVEGTFAGTVAEAGRRALPPPDVGRRAD
jgi:hypothetical protein